nr:uncharacterized protein LOC108942806 [Nicotiana tomentosiformis]
MTKSNAKWDDEVHITFIELCEQEIRKKNRPNTYLSKDGWKNIINEFEKKTGRGINDINGCDKEHFTLLNDEMNDESDDLQNINSVMFPEQSLKRQKSTDGVSTSSQVRKKKKTATTLIKEDIHSLIEFMSSKSTATSPAVDETSIEKCIDKLEQIPNILAGSEIYSFTMNIFRKKNNRQIFFGMPTDEARKSWLEFNYQLYLKKNG